jgi:hypothetical protein
VLFCCAAAAVCFFLKCPSLLYPRTEGDERIYWQLANNLAHNGDYSLRGSAVLKELSPHMYDRSLFHHPPLFPALLSLFVMAGMENAAVLVSWLGHVLAVLAVAIIGRHVLEQGSHGATEVAPYRLITAPAFWLPVLGVAADPLLMFVSRRIWIDSLLSGLVALRRSAGDRRRTTPAFARRATARRPYLGIDGDGFQMRHIAPAVAAVYVIVLALVIERERPVFLMVCGFTMLVGAVRRSPTCHCSTATPETMKLRETRRRWYCETQRRGDAELPTGRNRSNKHKSAVGDARPNRRTRRHDGDRRRDETVVGRWPLRATTSRSCAPRREVDAAH